MNHLATIVRKEIREMLTPGSVISVLVMVVLFAGLGTLIGSEVDSAAELPTFGLVAEEGDYLEGWDDGSFEWSVVDTLVAAYGDASDKIILMDSQYGDDDAIIAEMEDRGIAQAIAFPDRETFLSILTANIEGTESSQVHVRQYYTYEPTGLLGTVSSTLMTSIVSILSSSLSLVLMGVDGTDTVYEFLQNPISSSGSDLGTVVNGVLYTNVTPSTITNEISSQTMMIPLVIMIIIMMVGSIVISSMGTEKENKTLETLLTMPIKRTSIVSGKIVAAAVVGLVYGLAYMVGMTIYMNSLMGNLSDTGGVDLEAMGLTLDLTDWVLVMVSMFLSIVCALGICMILGAFAKNYKSAQTMTLPISILAMIPMFIIMFSGWYGTGAVLQFIVFIIPFSHPMMAMQSLMYGDTGLVLAGIAYMAVFALVTILITVRLYKSDILITGLGQNRWVQRITGRT